MSGEIKSALDRTQELIEAIIPYCHAARRPFDRSYRHTPNVSVLSGAAEDRMRLFSQKIVSISPTVARFGNAAIGRELQATIRIDVYLPLSLPAHRQNEYVVECEREIHDALCNEANWSGVHACSTEIPMFLGADRIDDATISACLLSLSYRLSIRET